jgi:hypothetical protein
MEEGATRIVNGFELTVEPVTITIGGRGKPFKWPFAAMEVSETAYVTNRETFPAARSALAYLHRKTGKRFRALRCGIGLRVQRVA